MSQIIQAIYMRTDMDSMNPGKAMAQAAHASTMMTEQIRHMNNSATNEMYQQWLEDGKWFGTCLTFAAPNAQFLHGIVDDATTAGLLAGVVHDPTYPLTDGAITHLLPMDTCAWVFGEKSAIDALTVQPLLKLHP